MFKFRPYQATVARAILESVLYRRGLTLSVEIARQGGKNELSAQLEVLLLTLYMNVGGNIVKCSPTFKPQTIISMQRLKERLDEWGYAGYWHSDMGYMIHLLNACAIFLSADESASVVGNTAHILLEVDESQDVSKEKYTKEFKPMGATTNVTTVHYGTTWDDSTLLEEVKQSNLELEKKDGLQRHFRFDWQEVAKYNPAYQAYVEAERARLGADHPLFLTQYCLVPIRGGGRLFTPAHRAQLQGTHARCSHPELGKVYAAGLDLAGQIEQDEDTMKQALTPGRDSTILTIAEVSPGPEPTLHVLEHYAWIGRPHAELYPQLVDLLKNTWKCQAVAVDATGIGEPIAAFLTKELGSRVIPFKFTQQSKSQLGFGLLAAINSGRLKLYARDHTDECTEFWRQVELARSQFRPNQTMNFFVEPSEGHDDFLMSLALLVESVRDYKPRTAKGLSPTRSGRRV